jgi:hypothetical protein
MLILKTTSDFYQKVEKLNQLMTELNISIDYLGNNTLIISDTSKHPFKDYILLCNDTNEPLSSFPCNTEYKLAINS